MTTVSTSPARAMAARRTIAVVMLAAAALGGAAPADAAPGYYNGIKLPYAAGVARVVVRSTSHGAGRHAVDFAMMYEPVLAMYAGRVAYVGESAGNGRHVLLDHGDGFCSNYLHFSKIGVRAGQRIQQGEVLGISGNTGKSSGPHLHAAVYRKSNSACGGGAASEVMMLFDEFPSRELRAGDWVVSRNGKPTAPFYPSVDLAASDRLLVKWNDYSNNETGFKVERRFGLKGAWAQIGVAPENALNFEDKGLAPRTQYCYRLRAFNNMGDSTYSNITCASTLVPGAAPAAPPPQATPMPAEPDDAATGVADSHNDSPHALDGSSLFYNGLVSVRLFLQGIGILPPEPEDGGE